MYSDYKVKLLCLIKQFAIFTCGLQTYFLRTSRVIGCVYFHTPRQTEPNRSPPSQICYTLGFGGSISGVLSKKHMYVLNLKKKIIFYFSLKRGSVNPHMKLVGLGTSKKVKNHYFNPFHGHYFRRVVNNFFLKVLRLFIELQIEKK